METKILLQEPVIRMIHWSFPVLVSTLNMDHAKTYASSFSGAVSFASICMCFKSPSICTAVLRTL